MLLDEMDKQLDVHDSLFRDVSGFIVFNQIEGDYLEFGVYRGDSVKRFRHWLNVHWEDFRWIGIQHEVQIAYAEDFLSKKRYFAFDSFEGLPHGTDASTPIHFVPGAYRAALDYFWANVSGGPGVSKPTDIVAIPGWFDKTLVEGLKATHDIRKAALIFVDCDREDSAELIWPFVTSLIADGTVIVIDDWFRYGGDPRKGVQGSFNRWKKGLPRLHCTEVCRSGANRIAFVCHWLGE